MDLSPPLGITIPLAGVPLVDQLETYRHLAAAGYTQLWSAEGPGMPDAFTPLAVASTLPGIRLGTAVVPVYSRGPATLAQSVCTLADTAPGRFILGIGSSSKLMMEDWNDARFVRPFERVRDIMRFLRKVLAGETVDETYGSFHVKGFRLQEPPAVAPPIVIAALRERMLRLGGAEADGVVLNLLAADDVGAVARIVHEAGDGKEIVARIVVAPSEDAQVARDAGRRLLGTYVNAPVYADFQRWIGRGSALERSWELWAAGRRREAAEAIPDEVVDALVLHGSPEQCRAAVERYREAGVTTPVVAILPLPGMDVAAAACSLARVGGAA